MIITFYYKDKYLKILNEHGFVHQTVKEPVKLGHWDSGRNFMVNIDKKTYMLADVIYEVNIKSEKDLIDLLKT